MQHEPAQAIQRDLLRYLCMKRQYLFNRGVSDGVRLILKARLRRFEVHLAPFLHSTWRHMDAAVIVRTVLLARNDLVRVSQKGAFDTSIRHILEPAEAEQRIPRQGSIGRDRLTHIVDGVCLQQHVDTKRGLVRTARLQVGVHLGRSDAGVGD